MGNEKHLPEFVNNVKETFKNNGTLLTIAAVALIIVSGVSIVDNRENWWVVALSTAGFFFVVFLFMNARTVIKAVLVSIFTLFLATSAFQIGLAIDRFGLSSLMWFSQILFVFFSLLSFSYLVNSPRSRWGLLGLTQLVVFILTYILLSLNLSSSTAILTSAIAGIIFFIFFYKNYRTHKKHMPNNVLNENTAENFVKSFKKLGWNATALVDGENEGGILLWKDYAYYLYPVMMSSPFTNRGRKISRLAYEGYNVTPWLLKTAFTKLPLWKSRGADITLVLLDMKNTNGKEPRIIGTDLPDTKKKLPVGVIPASDKNAGKIIKNIDKTLKPFKTELSDKQREALSRIGVTESVVVEDSGIVLDDEDRG